MTNFDRVTASFMRAFGGMPASLISAPGRVNLIGEHTDYNDGFVLPCAIDAATLVAISPRTDGQINIVASDYGDASDHFMATLPIDQAKAQWANHIRGVVSASLARGLRITGADIAVAGNVPQGAGLSSSASLAVALAKALLPGSDGVELARIAQISENDFVGCACGIMDQMASACAKAGHALLLDCRSLAVRHVAVPDHLAIMIIHSGVRRGLVDSDYNLRRQQCEAAARHCGVKALRDIDEAGLEANKAGLDPVAYRRARHVVTENGRTVAAAAALETGDARALGILMAASHVSMRDDFEITVPPVDRLVDTVKTVIGEAGGVRMTGGGFGGCVVALVPTERVLDVRTAVETHYVRPDRAPAMIIETRPTDGVSSLIFTKQP